MEENYHLANKKNLFQNLSEYYSLKGRCVFKEKVFPLTFHIKDGLDDPEYTRLVECFHTFPNSIWIIKPGENSNRGCGIQVVQSLKEINAKIKETKEPAIRFEDQIDHTLII